MTEAEKERAAVVAWQRRMALELERRKFSTPQARRVRDAVVEVLNVHTDAIERGDHLTGRP